MLRISEHFDGDAAHDAAGNAIRDLIGSPLLRSDGTLFAPSSFLHLFASAAPPGGSGTRWPSP